MPPKKRRTKLMPRPEHKKPRLKNPKDVDKHKEPVRDTTPTPSSGSRTLSTRKVAAKASDKIKSLYNESAFFNEHDASFVDNSNKQSNKRKQKATGPKSSSTTRSEEVPKADPKNKTASNRKQPLNHDKIVKQSTLFTALPPAFSNSSDEPARVLEGLNLTLNTAFPEISDMPRLARVASPVKVKSPNTYLRKALHADNMGPPSQSIMEAVAGGHNSPPKQKQIPRPTNSRVQGADTFAKGQGAYDSNDGNLSEATLNIPKSRTKNTRSNKNTKSAISLIQLPNNDKTGDIGTHTQKSTGAHISILNTTAEDGLNYPSSTTIDKSRFSNSKLGQEPISWKEKYEQLLNTRITKPEQMLQDYMESMSNRSEKLFSNLQLQRHKYEQNHIQQERKKWTEMIENIVGLKESILTMTGHSTENIEDMKNEVLNQFDSRFSSMLEEFSAQSTISSGKAGVRPKKQRETGTSLDAIEELKEELNSTYTKTSKDIEKILRYIQLNEFDNSSNSSQSKKQGYNSGKDRDEEDSNEEDDDEKEEIGSIKTTIQFLYYLCGVEVCGIDYKPTGIKYNCMQKGLFGQFVYGITVQTEPQLSRKTKSTKPKPPIKSLKLTDFTEVTYTPTFNEANMVTFNKLPLYFQDQLDFRIDSVSNF